jgi:arylsulfatase
VTPEGESSASAGKLDFRPAIVLITVDTLRRGHLGCYGYFRATSPRIDELAARSVLFENALATMASTFPSHLSILTGLYPYQHGIGSNIQAVREPFRSSEECVSLAQVLAGAGWRTAAFVSSAVLDGRTGIGAGFEVYEHPLLRHGPFQAARTTDRALEWLAEQESGAPFFLWIHYWDVHEPNEPEERYRAAFSSDAQLAAWMSRANLDAALLAERFGADASVGEHYFAQARTGRLEKQAAEKQGTVSVAIDRPALEDLWNRYDACVREVDDQVGRVIDALEERGLWERSIFVFTADHGQSLGEDLSFGHGRFTNLNTFVPLVIHFPRGVGGEPRREDALVSLVDLMPTVLARFDEPAVLEFLEQAEGTDVLSADFARQTAYVQEAARFMPQAETLECALLTRRWKYVHRDQGAEELYDLAGAGEFVDVSSEHPDVIAELERELQALLARRPRRAQPAELDAADVDALLEELEGLGYTGGEEE